MLATANRIIRAISTRHHHGGLQTPAPILSRIFQELSNGLLAYNSAVKMKEVPVPFAYVQYNAMMLIFFIGICPFAVGIYSSEYSQGVLTVVIATLLSAFAVGSFVAM